MDGQAGLGSTMTQHSAEDTGFMQLALRQAQAAGEVGEVPVGAVVVRAGQVIASGHNTPLASHDPTAHAEVNAIVQPPKHWATIGLTIAPCMSR